MSFPDEQDSVELSSINASNQKTIQSENIDWVQINVPASPTRVSEVLKSLGLPSRWGLSMQDCLRTISAIVFAAQGGRSAITIKTKSTDTVNAGEIPAGQDYYFPAVRIFDKFINGTGTATLILHTDAKLKSD